MLAAAAQYARWIDVSANRHRRTRSPARRHGESAAGARAGLGLRVHGNQLGPGPGVQIAVELGAASVDHCSHLSDADVDALSAARDTTVATLLPGVEFGTRSPYPNAARLVATGVSIALATDCNPGTCYYSSMPWVISLAVTAMDLTPARPLCGNGRLGTAAAHRHRSAGGRAEPISRYWTHQSTCTWPTGRPVSITAAVIAAVGTGGRCRRIRADQPGLPAHSHRVSQVPSPKDIRRAVAPLAPSGHASGSHRQPQRRSVSTQLYKHTIPRTRTPPLFLGRSHRAVTHRGLAAREGCHDPRVSGCTRTASAGHEVPSFMPTAHLLT
jgi:hypothetical protein